VAAPFSYWLIPLPGARLRPELRAFISWVRSEASTTRNALGETQDNETSATNAPSASM